ncbi:hypothetical protein O181_023338, partial [Austropuccinia psidii MF-1]|nr:hypothetical protein [Austropuccinia psidii MF-1]
VLIQNEEENSCNKAICSFKLFKRIRYFFKIQLIANSILTNLKSPLSSSSLNLIKLKLNKANPIISTSIIIKSNFSNDDNLDLNLKLISTLGNCNQKIRILQNDSIELKHNYFCKILLTEPVLQGIFSLEKTSIFLIFKNNKINNNSNQLINFTTFKYNLINDNLKINNNLNHSKELKDHQEVTTHDSLLEQAEEDNLKQEESDDDQQVDKIQEESDEFEIDQDFLAHSIINQPLTQQPHQHRLPNHLSNLAHPLVVLPLSSPIQSTYLNHQETFDQNLLGLIRTTDLTKIGVISGQWVLITSFDPINHSIIQHRLIKLIATDSLEPFSIFNHPSLPFQPQSISLLISPILLFNLLGIVSYSHATESIINKSISSPLLRITPTGLGSGDCPPVLPIIRSLTLARISSPQSLTKSYQSLFLNQLKQHFQSQPINLQAGDTIAIGIDGTISRFTENRSDSNSIQPESHTDLDHHPFLVSQNHFFPTVSIYFKVTKLELTPPNLIDHNSPKNQQQFDQFDMEIFENDLMIEGLIQDGLVGGIVDPKLTKLVQTGLEFGFVPDVQSWIGIDGLSPLSQINLNAKPEACERKLYDYLKAASKAETRDYDLNLNLLINGPRGSGKSSLAKRAADATGFNFLELNCFDLLGETEAKTGGSLRARFERALAGVPCVLVLRHLEGLARKSQRIETGQEPGVIGLLRECLGEARRSRWEKTTSGYPLVVIGTTTELDQLPLTLLSLFKSQLVISSPSEAERHEILAELLRKDLIAPDVDLKLIALETAGLVANDLVHLVSRARTAAIARVGIKSSNERQDLADAGIQLMAEDLENGVSTARSAYSKNIGAPRIPKVSWEDIGGLARVREEILETVQLPIQHPELFANGLKRRSGLLLYGPPGTGKTLLAKAVATSCGLNFLSVKGPELLNMYIGESEANVRRVFEKARGARPCVIFFDELDSVAPKRGNQGDSGGVMDRIVSQLLAELDGMSSEENGAGEVIVIGATNRPDLLDPALLRPGRFDKMIYLGIANDREHKVDILRALTRKFKFEEDLTLDWVIDRLEEDQSKNFTGADFYAICSEAMMRCLSRRIEKLESGKMLEIGEDQDEGIAKMGDDGAVNEEIRVGRIDFLAALQQVVPSISLHEMKHYEEVQMKFGRGNLKDEVINQVVDKKGKSRAIE